MTAGEQVESRPTILVVTPHGAAAKQTSGTNFVLDLFSLRDVVEDKRKQGIRLVGFIDDVAILGRTPLEAVQNGMKVVALTRCRLHFWS